MRIEAYFQLSGEKITHNETKTRARETQRNCQGSCRVDHEKCTFPTLRLCRQSWMATIFGKNLFIVSKTFGTKTSFENLFDARVVRVRARSMFSEIIGIQLCSVKFHRARLSALRQVPSCSRAMLRRLGKYRIPSVKFHRVVRVYLRSVNFFVFSRNDVSFFKYWIPQLTCEKIYVFFRSRKLAKNRTKLNNSNTKTSKRRKRFKS